MVIYYPVLLKIKYHYLSWLVLLGFCLNISAEEVEVVSEGNYFKILLEGDFSFANKIHGELIVEIDKIVFFLYDVGIVIWIEEDEFDV